MDEGDKTLKEINKVLFKKMGLAKHHIEEIKKEISEIRQKKTLIIKNKSLDDKQKKEQINELVNTSLHNLDYHLVSLGEHITPDIFSINSYLEATNKANLEDKEKQLKEGVQLGFITAEEAEKRREKWSK